MPIRSSPTRHRLTGLTALVAAALVAAPATAQPAPAPGSEFPAAGEGGSGPPCCSSGSGVGPGGHGTGANVTFAKDRFYRLYFGTIVQRRIRDAASMKREKFSAEFDVWIDPAGRVTKAELLRTSGSGKRDRKLVAIIEATDLDPPPASIRFPVRITVQGRQSSI